MAGDLAADLAGLDTLERLHATQKRPVASRLWQSAWPKLAAAALALLAWQLVVWAHWRPTYVLPTPHDVLTSLDQQVRTGRFWRAVGITLTRAGIGFGLASLLGTALGLAIARARVLRSAVGSLLTGLQTMPSIAWFPLAILVFQLSERAIIFVVVLGAAPSIANGLIAGIDHIPPLLLRAGRVLGARRVAFYRFVVLPAALPGYLGGLKQGWAFAWRSLMAGELLVIIAHRPSLGVLLEYAQQNNDAAGLVAVMLVILVIGIMADTLFSTLSGTVRTRWGYADQTE